MHYFVLAVNWASSCLLIQFAFHQYSTVRRLTTSPSGWSLWPSQFLWCRYLSDDLFDLYYAGIIYTQFPIWFLPESCNMFILGWMLGKCQGSYTFLCSESLLNAWFSLHMDWEIQCPLCIFVLVQFSLLHPLENWIQDRLIRCNVMQLSLFVRFLCLHWWLKSQYVISCNPLSALEPAIVEVALDKQERLFPNTGACDSLRKMSRQVPSEMEEFEDYVAVVKKIQSITGVKNADSAHV